MRLRLELVITSVLAAATAASLLAPLTFALDRDAVLHGELWRLWTGHLVHWDLGHLVWDGVTFSVLAWLLGRLAPGRLAVLLAAGPPLISLAVLAAEPHLDLYGGLSGLDVALWVAVCLEICHQTDDRPTRSVAWLALAGGLAKVGLELATGGAVLVGDTVPLVVAAHVAGTACAPLLRVLVAGPWRPGGGALTRRVRRQPRDDHPLATGNLGKS